MADFELNTFDFASIEELVSGGLEMLALASCWNGTLVGADTGKVYHLTDRNPLPLEPSPPLPSLPPPLPLSP